MKVASFRISAAALIIAFFSQASFADESGFVVKSQNLEVRLSPAGQIESLKTADGIEQSIKAKMALANCSQEGETKAEKLDGGGVKFVKRFVGPQGGRVTVIEKFLPAKDSVRWELEIVGEGEPWSAPIETRLSFPQEEPSTFWTSWGDPRPDGTDWTNPLRSAEWQDREFFYGGRRFKYFKEPSTFSIPLATVMDQKRDAAVSIVLSPEDLIIGLKMKTTKAGEVIFSRENHRLGKGDVVRCAMDLIAHPADWRGALGWTARRYPQFFDPPNPQVAQMAGCGAYSSHADITDVERLMRMAFRVNWKASFDFPFMGMFVPPVASDDEEWTDFAGQKISIAKMRASSKSLREMGFYLLNYFNVTEFGAKTKYPAPSRKAANDEELWKDANDFLHYALGDAILPGENGKPIFSWEGCVVMDPGEKVYADFLIEQARRHIEKFPESSGICIDRLDWLMEYNRRRDDGVTWFEGKPARALAVSWLKLMERLSPTMHDAGKVIYVNTMYPRLDLMGQVDGVYDEHGQHPHSLNVSTLLAANKPYMAWTWEPEEFDKNPDEYFQRHLHLGAYLTAPVPGNDHTMLPDPKRDQYYLDYGPMLDALRGKRWLLMPHAVRVEGDKALANIFEVPGGYVVPITFGPAEKSARIELGNLPQAENGGFTFDVLQPGEGRTGNLIVDKLAGNRYRIEVPLKRGCAMLLVKQTWMEPAECFFHAKAKIELKTALEGAKLHYTLDGKEPTAQSTEYSSPVEIQKTTVAKAAAFRGEKRIGATLEREYVKIPPEAPIISSASRFFDEAVEVAIRSPHPAEGESIRYTLDGSVPTKESSLYAKPLRIDRTVQLQAVRITREGSSPTVSGVFTRRGPKPPLPDVSLADLKPLKATVGWGDHPRMNRAIDDVPLSLGGKIYEKGIGVHADSELEFELKPEYTRFVSVIGLDDAMQKLDLGNIIFEIEIDGAKVLGTPVLRPGEYMYVDVPIPAGSKKIRLMVFGGGMNMGIAGDHGDWADAGFIVAPR